MSLLLPFKAASGKHHPRRGPIVWLVLHTTESDIGPLGPGDQGAERTAAYFQSSAAGTSSTWVVDDDSAIQCVALGDEPWTQAPWNPFSVSIEQEGRAAFTRADWLGAHSGMLDQAANIIASCYTALNIPLRYLTGAEIAASLLLEPDDPNRWPKGVTTHVELNAAARALGLDWCKRYTAGSLSSSYTQSSFIGELTSHTDPGMGYPIDEVLARARRLLDPTIPVTPPTEPITFPEGEDSMLMIHVPVAADGRECYARFSGEISKSPTGGLAIRDVVWIDGYTNDTLKNLGFQERRLAVADLRGVALLGPYPTKNPDGSPMDPIHDWKPSDFMRVIGA